MGYTEFADRATKILVNKAIEGGNASSTSWITVPNGSTATLAALERRVGSVAFDTTLNSFVVDDGTGFHQIGISGASALSYDNTTSKLSSTNVQAAIDEITNFRANWRVFSDFELGPTTSVPSGQFIGQATGVIGSNPVINANQIGVIQIGTASSATANAAVRTFTNILCSGGGVLTFETNLQVTTLADTNERYIVRAGFANVATAAPANGYYFEYDQITSNNWRICAANNSTRTQTTTSTAVTTNFDTLKIVVNAANTSAEFFINGVSVGTVTSNLPASSTSQQFGVLVSIVKSLGTTSREVNIDWIEAKKVLTGTR
jgi:hypothetical protein